MLQRLKKRIKKNGSGGDAITNECTGDAIEYVAELAAARSCLYKHRILQMYVIILNPVIINGCELHI